MRRVVSLGIVGGLALLATQACERPSGGAAVADGATVTPSATLRQGQDGVSLVVTRAAGGLASASAFDLPGLVVEPQPGRTDTRLVLALSVPHGVALGARTLTFTDAHGVTAFANVVEVGAITSGPTGADTDLGTADAPFRSVRRALIAAGAGDTIQLLDGAYDAMTGETWGYTAPANLTIAGQSTAGTRLVGPKQDGAMGGAIVPLTTALLAPASLTLENLTLESFDVAVDVTGPGALTLDDLVATDTLTAAVRADAAGVTVTVAGGALGGQQDAILLADPCAACALTVTSTSLSGALLEAGHTIEIAAAATGSRIVLQKADIVGDLSVKDATATVSVSGSRFGTSGAGAHTMIDFGGRTLDVSDTTLAPEAGTFGINFAGQTMTLTGVTLQGGTYGVYQLMGSAKLRGTQLRDYRSVGYYVAQGDLDLGTATAAGDDAFSTSTTGPTVYGLYVDSIGQVTSSNTTFNGVEPPAGRQAPGPDASIDLPGEYHIDYGKAISFWTL